MKLPIFVIICLSFVPRATAATYGQKMVAAVLMAEAWSEGELGMTAVAEVIRTRADATGTSPLAVISTPKHFSCLNRTSVDKLYKKFAGERDFEVALRIARILYNEPEKLPGLSKGADHFTRADERPVWARGKRPIIAIGNHAFYRLGIYKQGPP
jgi:spore germination cell wall hydrolase CwlJ-like protein